MLYAGFTLQIFVTLAISCVLVLRWRRPEMKRPFRVWGYPLTPLVFLAVSVAIMFWAFIDRPTESSLALLTAAGAGVIFYAMARRAARQPDENGE